YLEVGMFDHIRDLMKSQCAALVIAVKKNDVDGMIETFEDMGLLDNVEDMNSFHRELEKLLTKYYEASLATISLGQLLIDILAIAYRYQVDIPTDITVLAKAILT